MGPYNGYTGTQRDRKYEEYKRLRKSGPGGGGQRPMRALWTTRELRSSPTRRTTRYPTVGSRLLNT